MDPKKMEMIIIFVSDNGYFRTQLFLIPYLLTLLVVIWYNKVNQDTKREGRGDNDDRERDTESERGRDAS